MLETIINYEAIIWFALLIVLCVVYLVDFIITKIRDHKEEKKDKLTWYDYHEVRTRLDKIEQTLMRINKDN